MTKNWIAMICLAIVLGATSMAQAWDACSVDMDGDQDVDGSDIFLVAQAVSGGSSQTLPFLAAELGRNDCLQNPLTITSPLDGQLINAQTVLVEGTIDLPVDGIVGITVNGVPAMMYNNRFILNHLQLISGANNLTVKATDAQGGVIQRSITVNATLPASYVRLDADKEIGMTPLQSKLYVNGNFAFSGPADIATSGPGTVTFIESGTDRFRVEMNTPGVYYLTATVTDSQSVNYSDTLAIIVLDETSLDAMLQAKFQAMLGSLRAGAVEDAVAHMATNVRQTYRANFNLLNSHLTTMADGLHDMQLIRISGSKAEYNIQGDQGGQTYSFYVVFIKDVDGIWRIGFF